MLSVLSVVAGLGVIILFHELGHFLVAKAVGLEVPRFSIGFPPHLVRWKAGGTEYCLGAIPLGGYVKVDLGTSGGGPPPDVPWYLRALVTVSGPASNFVLTALLLVLILGVVGWDVALYPPVVGEGGELRGLAPGDTVVSVSGTTVRSYSEMLDEMLASGSGTMVVGSASGRREVSFSLAPGEVPFSPLVPPVIGESMIGMPAYEAGIRPGDSIVSVDGNPVPRWEDFQREVSTSSGELAIVYRREGVPDTAFVTPVAHEGSRLAGVRVSLPATRTVLPLGRAALEGIGGAFTGAVNVVTTLAELVRRPRELAQSSGGPVYVAETLSQQARTGLPSYLWTIASISLAIMVFNLLPIPVLDGGQLLLLVAEGIRGRPLSKRSVQVMQQAGVVLILLIFVFIMFQDVSRVMTRVR